MKNVKIHKTMAFILAANIALTGCATCNIKEDHSHIYIKKDKSEFDCHYGRCGSHRSSQEELGYIKNDELGEFCKQNDLFPLEQVKNMIKEAVAEENLVAAITCILNKTKEKPTFIEGTRLLTKDDLKDYTGLVKIGTPKDVLYTVYKIKEEQGTYTKEKQIVKNIDTLEGEYYIDFFDVIYLNTDEIISYVDGQVRTLKK